MTVHRDGAAPPPNAGQGDGEVTALLRRAHLARREALDALVPIVYDTLRRIARQQLAGERRGHTLTATALAHEAYTRLVGLTRIEWRDRAHFFAAAGAMRGVLIDYAAARNAHKRGCGADAVEVDLDGIVADDRLDDLLTVHRTELRRTAAHDRLPAADRRTPGGHARQLAAGRRRHHRPWGLRHHRPRALP